MSRNRMQKIVITALIGLLLIMLAACHPVSVKDIAKSCDTIPVIEPQTGI